MSLQLKNCQEIFRKSPQSYLNEDQLMPAEDTRSILSLVLSSFAKLRLRLTIPSFTIQLKVIRKLSL